MAGKVRQYYAAGNTARGFYNLFDSVLDGLERLYILKGGPGTGKSTLMQKVSKTMTQRGFDTELIHCASDKGSIDGIILTDLKAGIVDGTAPHVIEPKAPGAVEEYVNLGVAWDSQQLRPYKEDIYALNARIKNTYEQTYHTLAEALHIRDEWEKLDLANQDQTKANDVVLRLIETIFSDHTLSKQAKSRHMFRAATTPQGPVDFVQNLTTNCEKRYLIKARSDCNKSNLFKQIAAEAEKRGLDTEKFHCDFDPHRLNMVIVPELKVALFDNASPLERFPGRPQDEVIDLDELIVTTGISEKHHAQRQTLRNRYIEKKREAHIHLQHAKELRDRLERIYIQAMDFSRLEHIQTHIQAEIDEMAKSTRV